MDVDDVGMIDAISRSGFPQHPGTQMRLAPKIRSNQLYGNYAVDENMAGSINDAHSPLTDSCFQSISASNDLP
jgi:hypothetical protein